MKCLAIICLVFNNSCITVSPVFQIDEFQIRLKGIDEG